MISSSRRDCVIQLSFSLWDTEPSPVPLHGETDFAGWERAAEREPGKSKKGPGKFDPRALAVGLIAVFILGQGTVPCPIRKEPSPVFRDVRLYANSQHTLGRRPERGPTLRPSRRTLYISPCLLICNVRKRGVI